MGWLDDRLARLLAPRRRAVPVPAVPAWQEGQPYSRAEVAPDEYGNYLATSNDVYSCAWLRAKNLAALPIQVFGPKGEEIAEDRPLPRLLARPNPHMTRLKILLHTELCLSIWGEAVLLLERGSPNPAVLPREIWPVKPTLIKAIPHASDFISGYVYTPPGGGQPIPLRPDEVIHIQYPNPSDLYAPLPPMAAVRLAAEVASEAMKANRAFFRQGMLVGGFVMPPDSNSSYTLEQAKELEEMIARRFTGASQAHRWQVLRYFLSLKEMAVSPKDAQWIEGSNLTFRQVCRGMGVPPALVGDSEYATLANLTVYERALWSHTMEFEATFIAAELTRQLVPAFAGASHIAFDLSNIVALQEDEDTRWGRQKTQIELGAITINEWREDEGLAPVPWGSAWWAPLNKAPVSAGSPPPTVTESRALRARRPPDMRDIEDGFRDDLESVFERQKDAILQTLRQGEQVRTVEAAAAEPFDVARWTERSRSACHARFVAATERSMLSEAQLLQMNPEQVAKMLTDRATRAAIEGNVQRFAHHVTTTTYNQVKAEIASGVRKGETVDQISRRVAHVMDGRISDARRIAQSEITRSGTTGQMAAFQMAMVNFKRWVTMADDAVRDSHRALHGETRPLAEMFQVGIGMATGPGHTGLPEEDVNCRCWLEPAMERSAGIVEGDGWHRDGLEAVRQALEAA